MPPEGLIAIDWGTTNRRIFVLAADGSLQSREADARGVTALGSADFPAEMAALRARFGDRLFLLGGMIGSTRGWVEAPYLPCPVTLDMLASGLAWVEAGRIAIVPGACMRGDAPDVMRGEEVQLLGAVAAGMVQPDAALCLPGTHAKWASIENGALARFRTIITGELFALLRNHSILSGHLAGGAGIGPAFREGVRRGLFGDTLTADLFGVRARVLLGELAAADAPSYASGLLIGTDIRIGLSTVKEGTVALIGDPALTRLYAAALGEAGRAHQEVDGEQAFLAGIAAIAEKIG